MLFGLNRKLRFLPIAVALTFLVQLMMPITALAQDEATPTPQPETPTETQTETVVPPDESAPEDSITESTDAPTSEPTAETLEIALGPVVVEETHVLTTTDNDISLMDVTQALVDTALIITTGDPSGRLGIARCGAPVGATFRYYLSDATHPNGTCSYAGGVLTAWWNFPIQQAVNDAATTSGSVITVEAGTYNENLTISRNIRTLQGSGIGSSTINGSILVQNLTAAFVMSGFTVNGTVTVTNDSTVTLSNLNVNANSTTAGITITGQNNATTLTDDTVRNSGGDGIAVSNSTGALTINTSTSSNTAGSGLETVNSSGTVTLNGVTMNSNGDDGASINNSNGTNNVTLTGTNNFNNNSDTGLEITTGRRVTINTSAGSTSANNNGNLGISIVNTGGTASGTRTIGIGNATTSTTTSTNTNGDISISAGGNTTLNNVTAINSTSGYGLSIASTVAGVATTLTGGNYTGNRTNGVTINNLGTVSLTNTSAQTNGSAGLNTITSGAVTLTGVTMNGNTGNGATIDNTSGANNLTLAGVNTFSNNGGTGLSITTGRQVTINTTSGATTANSNGNLGISITNTGGTAGGTRTIRIGNATTSTTANDNTNANISITAGGNTTLTNVIATNSRTGNGLTIASTVSGVTATITNGIYSGNRNNGININNLGNVSITGALIQNNGNYGLDLTSNAATVTIQRNQFINNGTNNASPTDITLTNNNATAFWTMSTNYFSGQGYSFRLGAGRVNANNNWWGSNSQPLNGVSGPSEGYFLAIPVANLTLTRWIVLRMTAAPTLINGTTVSTITADMRYNNLGATGFGNLPNGIQINFSTTRGNLSSSFGLLNTGTTTTTLSSGGTEGYAIVSGSVGNQTTNAPQITIDLNGPTTTISSNPASYTNSTSATFTYSATDPYSAVTGYPCSRDGAAYGACTSPTTYIGLATGSHSFSVVATDAAGNIGAPASWSWVIDLTAPVITPIMTGTMGNNGWYTSDVNITWTASEPESNPTLITSGCASQSVNADTSGITFTCSATSAGGSSSSSVTIKRDATAPAFTPSLAPPASASGWWNISTGAPTLSFTCSDAMSGLAVACPSTYLFGEGAGQSFSGGITDNAGNSSSIAVSNVNVDLAAPSITANITPAASGTGWYNIATGAPTVQFTCSDAVSGTASCPADHIFGENASQSYTGNVSDIAGNTNSASVTNIDVDLTQPSVTASISPAADIHGWWNVTTGAPSISFVCSDSLSGVVNCPGDHLFNDGTGQSFSATVFDNAGNLNSNGASGIDVDLANPAATISAKPNAFDNSTSAGFTFTVDDPMNNGYASGIDWVECQLDGGGYSACDNSSSQSYTGLTESGHTFELRTTDHAGNSSMTATYSWVIDTTAPLTAITLTPPNNSTSETAVFNFTSTDTNGIDHHECNLDNLGWILCTSPLTYYGLNDGLHEFAVRGVDLAGNTANPATYRWTINTHSARGAGNPGIPVQNPIIPVTGGEQTPLSCTGLDSLQLPGGDRVEFTAILCGYTATLNQEQGSTLPASLADGQSFVTGLTVNVFRDTTPLGTFPFGTTVRITFKLPAGTKKENLSVLYWDSTLKNGIGDWVTLPLNGGLLSPDQSADNRRIYQTISEESQTFTITLNFTGTFVITTK